jgi:hypothetical protein
MVRCALILLLAVAACGPSATDDRCGARAACTNRMGAAPDGGLPGYVFCTNPEATYAWYQTTDGKKFECVSASDCAIAFQAVTNWCKGP